MADSSLIQIQNLNSFYGKRQVLFDVGFSIPREHITVIMGRSGCGKSTLLKHLIGLKRTPRGCVFVNGEDFGAFDESELKDFRESIGVLFQGGALFNSMTVAENVAVPLKVHTRLAAETIRIMAMLKLNLVGLSTFSEYMPSQLSGGMRKRAGLARALAMDPALLFVDEPSSGLDPITAAGLDDLILELRDSAGMTVVVVTHELESAFRIANQMVVMENGRILAAGTPDAIKNSTDPRVEQFLGRQSDSREKREENLVERIFGQ